MDGGEWWWLQAYFYGTDLGTHHRKIDKNMYKWMAIRFQVVIWILQKLAYWILLVLSFS